MKKILIVGPDYFGYNESVAKGFRDLGWDAMTMGYYEAFPNNIKNFMAYRLLPKLKVQTFFEDYYSKLNSSVISKVEQENPQYILFIKGTYIREETLRAVRKKAKVILWMMDSIYRYKDALNNIDLYDYKFMFEESDVSKLGETGIHSVFLPMAADEYNYYPILDCNKEIDLLFVGKLYENRLKMFERLIKRFPNLNIKIYGNYTALKKPISYLKYYFTDIKRYFTNSFVSPEELNQLYSQSKIALNIHHTQSQTGCNPRVFEILASKTFQLVDLNTYIKENFQDNHLLEGYSSEEELFDKIDYYIKHENERQIIANNGYQNVINNHTFKHRAMTILQHVEHV